jgi:hypothetical protein
MAVPAAYFPRPLYPPDASASGRRPSTDGPDVEAYKRTVWRLGRWPGPASNFDRAYSNAFAHGKGGNVIETGVAGFQRQMRIDDTGWVGKHTFNALASARVPDQLPHGGEMGMDANACNLVAQAYELYGGEEPDEPQPGKTTRARALDAAIGDLGAKESPPESNRTKYGGWYGMDGQPWCAMAVSYWYEVDAGGSPSFAKASSYSYCPYIVSDARNQRNGLSVTGSPVAGDLVVYDWGFDGTYDHVGLFEQWVSGNAFTAIEGNTSVDNDSNGGEVMRRQRAVPNQATLFVRVAEP